MLRAPTGFARLAYGAFYETIILMTFYEIINKGGQLIGDERNLLTGRAGSKRGLNCHFWIMIGDRR